jgi:hypothetical protein
MDGGGTTVGGTGGRQVRLRRGCSDEEVRAR